MSETKKNALGSIGFGVVLGLLILLGMSVKPVISRFETMRHPVTTPAEVFNVRAVEGGVLVSARSEKLRDCDWTQTEFRFGPRFGRSVPMLRAAHLGPPQLNVKGDKLYWKDIFLPVSPDMVEDTHWNAYHFCYPALAWETKTEFFN